MRAIRLIAALALAGIIAVGCGGGGSSSPSPVPSSANPPSSFETYSDPSGEFTIASPPDWETKPGSFGTSVAFLSPSPASDPFRENVNVYVEKLPSAISLSDYTRANKRNIERLITDFHEQAERDLRLNGRAAHEIRYTGSQGQLDLTWIQVWTVHGDRGYVLTYTGEGDDFDRFERVAMQMFGSFQLS